MKSKYDKLQSEFDDLKKVRDRFRNQTLDQKVELKRMKQMIQEEEE